MSKLRIPVTLTSGINEPVVEASEVKDVSFNKNQSKINEDTSRAIGNINNLVVGEDNLVDAINVNSNSIVTLDETKANKVDVQTALDLKADKTDLNSYVNDASYDSNTKRINFKHNSTVLAYIDATDFIKDGMVSNVTIENGYLVITFNTDSGQEPIRIALTDIFNPDNYYTKAQIDQFNSTKADKSDTVRNISFDDETNDLIFDKNGTLTEVSLDDIKARGTNVEAEYRSPFSSTYTQNVQSGFERITNDVMHLDESKVDKEELDDALANKANIDGSYDSMAVGIAKNLEGRKSVEDSFFERTTGGEAEVANGVAQLEEIQGNTGVVNQLVKNSNFADGTTDWKTSNSTIAVQNNILTLTSGSNVSGSVLQQTNGNVITGHKYLFCAVLTHSIQSNVTVNFASCVFAFSAVPANSRQVLASITTFTGTAGSNLNIYPFANTQATGTQTAQIELLQCFDLTLMYGKGNEPGTVDEFEQRLKDNLNLSLDEYIAYTQGKLVNVTFEGIESTGRNLLDPTTNKARILGVYSDDYDAYYGITGTYGTLTFVSDKGETTTITPDSEGKFLLEESGYLTVANPSECCVFLWWDGSKTDYVDYDKQVANLDTPHIYGKANGAGDLVQVFPTGLAGIGDAKDLLTIENGAAVAVKNTARVNLGDLTGWTYYSSAQRCDYNLLLSPTPAKPANNNTQANILCSDYVIRTATQVINNDKSVGLDLNGYIRLKDANITSADISAGKIAKLNGVYLEYELATPIIYTDLVYMGSELFADGTPVELPMNYKVDNWGIERILPQNTSEDVVTAKPIISCKYSIDAVEDLDTLHTQIDNLDEKKPNKEGTYPNMVVGAAKALEGSSSVPAEYTFRKVDDSVSSGLAMLKQIKGKSLAWNSMVRQVRNFGTEVNGLTITYSADGKSLTVNGTATANTDNKWMLVNDYLSAPQIANHVYLFKGCPAGGSTTTYRVLDRSGRTPIADYGNGCIAKCTTTLMGNSFYIAFDIKEGTVCNNLVFTPALIDLTLMFGEGNEPATVAEFEALYNKFPYDYNTGEIINNKTTAIESTGFNQWDEEWELGAYNNNNGTPQALTDRIRCKNFIPCLPNTSYYDKIGASGTNLFRVLFYDSQQNFISANNVATITNNSFTTPSNCFFIKFYLADSYGTTYKNDICINISNTTKNGTYEPYEKFTLDLNLPTATGKREGDEESSVICPDGLKSAGSAYDYGVVENGYLTKIVKVIGTVDLGTLNWKQAQRQSTAFYVSPTNLGAKPSVDFVSSKDIKKPTAKALSWAPNTFIGVNDAKYHELTITDYNGESVIFNTANDSNYGGMTQAEFKAAMNGVMLNYELATPEVWTLDTPIYVGYQVRSGGTEKRLPEDTASEVTAPFACDVVYPLDAVGFINDANEKLINKESMTEFLSQLGTAMGGTWTMTWDATTQKYNFTFVSNS